jgi:hypothetical protein
MTMKRKLILTEFIFSIVLTFLLITQTVNADSVNVSIDCVANVTQSQDFVAKIKIDGVTDFDACNYDVSYNAAILQTTNVTSGLIGSTLIPVDMWKIISPGTVRIMQNVAGVAGVTGSGYLAEIHFHVISSSGSSALSFSNCLLGDKAAQAINATWTDGSVQIITNGTSEINGGGGGGGGGSSGGGAAVSGEKRTTALLPVTSSTFEILDDVEALSVDIHAKLNVKKGTVLVNKQGQLVPYIMIEKMVNPPSADENRQIAGGVYDFQPDGAKFDPAVLLTLKYDIASILEGISDDRLYIVTWNAENQEWERMESTVDPLDRSITTYINHFSIYTIMADTRPASFTVTDMMITPSEPTLGQSMDISAVITNTGDLTGSYSAELKIDNEVAQTKEIKLDGGASQRVSFSITPDVEGEYVIGIGGATGRVVVQAIKLPPLSPFPTATALVPTPAPVPASFIVSDLTVNPSKAMPGEQIIISVLVTNIGGSEATYNAILEVNMVAEAKKYITLGAGKSGMLAFNLAKGVEGNYEVGIGDLFTNFIVTAPITVSAEPVNIVMPRNWVLISIVFVGCIVIAILFYLFGWRK